MTFAPQCYPKQKATVKREQAGRMSRFTGLTTAYTALFREYNALTALYTALIGEYTALRKHYTALMSGQAVTKNFK